MTLKPDTHNYLFAFRFAKNGFIVHAFDSAK
ncbi:MAG TPA: hypothetical protein DCF97_13680 [Plesiomonas shigelloides]|nr:hypothetical protein [Plesiomonas shigelloides]